MPTFDRAPLAAPSVLVFLHSFEPGGVERIALRLVAYWQKAGAPAALFMGRTEGAMAGHFASSVTYSRAPRTFLPVRHFETLWMIVQLLRHIRRTRPDMLFAAGNSYAVVAVALKLLLGKRCPPIVMKISNDLVRPDMIAPFAMLYRCWLRVQGRFIDRFIAMSDALACQIAREMAAGRDRVEMIANPSLDTPAPPTPRPERPSTPGRSFCAVGRLTRQKNLAMMLRAFARGARREDHLTLYGDGPERKRLEALARRLDITDRVRFAGFVPDPRTGLSAHDAMLLSSHFEGMPSVVIEALDARLHIIATDCCCSMRWLLDSGQLGALVTPGDEIGMARAIAEAPHGQRNAEAAQAKADIHRIARIAPDYLHHFARLHHRQPIRAPADQPRTPLATGFAR